MLLERIQQSETLQGGNHRPNWIYCGKDLQNCQRTSCCLTKAYNLKHQQSEEDGSCDSQKVKKQAKIEENVYFHCNQQEVKNDNNISRRKRVKNLRKTIDRKSRLTRAASKAFYFRSKQAKHTTYARFVGKRHLRRKRKRKSDSETEVHMTYITKATVWQKILLTIMSIFAIFQTFASFYNYQAIQTNQQQRFRLKKTRQKSIQNYLHQHYQHKHQHQYQYQYQQQTDDIGKRIYYNNKCCDYFKTFLESFKSRHYSNKKRNQHTFIAQLIQVAIEMLTVCNKKIFALLINQQLLQQQRLPTGSTQIEALNKFSQLSTKAIVRNNTKSLSCCKFSHKYFWLTLFIVVYLNFFIKGK